MAGMARAFPHVSDLHDYAGAHIVYVHLAARAYVMLSTVICISLTKRGCKQEQTASKHDVTSTSRSNIHMRKC
jgi:hypothetical protein